MQELSSKDVGGGGLWSGLQLEALQSTEEEGDSKLIDGQGIMIQVRGLSGLN